MKTYKSFNDVYKTADWYYGLKPFRELPGTLDNWTIPKNPRAADLGCGEGRDSIYLATKGFSVTAIDIVEQGLLKLERFAEENSLPIKCLHTDALDYRYPSNFFDVIVARTFLDHLTLPQIQEMIAKIKTTVRSSGILFVSVFTTKDVGYMKPTDQAESECASFIQHYFEENELKSYFEDWNIMTYYERTKIDTSHGPAHQHGVAHLVAEKPK